jgi:hypothetical protein
MSGSGHVGEEDAHLTVVQLSGCAAILHLDPGRVGSPFGKTTLINHIHRKEGLGSITVLLTDLEKGRWAQTLHNVCSQLIADSRVIPDSPREQALHAIGTGLFGVFCDLPTIFSGNLADHGLQVEQSVLTWLRTSEVGSQALMQVDQGERPSSYLA